MQRQSRSDDHPPPHSPHRLNRMFGEINAFLLALAIGLAALDFTCFALLKTSTEITWAQLTPTTPSPSLACERSIQSKLEVPAASFAFK